MERVMVINPSVSAAILSLFSMVKIRPPLDGVSNNTLEMQTLRSLYCEKVLEIGRDLELLAGGLIS